MRRLEMQSWVWGKKSALEKSNDSNILTWAMEKMENWYGGDCSGAYFGDEETKLGLVLNMFTFEIFIKHLRGDVKWVTHLEIQDTVHHVKDISRWESGVKEWAKDKGEEQILNSWAYPAS